MQAMIECGFLPKSAITVDQQNVPIFGKGSQVLDVFVPVVNGPLHFSKSGGQATPSDSDYLANWPFL